LLPLTIVQLWDPVAAAKEVRRNADRGCHAVCFSEIPANLGLPSIHDENGYWMPFFEACNDTGTTINMHIGSGSKMPSTSPDAPAAVGSVLTFANCCFSMVDWLMSGLFTPFPDLKIAYSEGQIGWIPYILERADDVWNEHRAWAGVKDLIPEAPSSYYYKQIYTCFFRDRHGIDSLDKVGIDNVTFETDYPHTDSTWPNTLEVAIDLMGHLTPEQQYKIVRGNAIKMLGLDIV
jgi:predicted TIM-barrel fold metal-dependent hydrolase